MWYLTILTVITAAIAAWFFFKKASPDGALDVNKDGKVTADDVKAVADVNKDGKVNANDAKAAVTAVVEQVKVIAAKPEPVPVVVEITPPAPKAKRKATAPKAPAAPAKKTTRKAKKQWPT